jgi:aminoglycoside phosphotransferase (APT) family kinase protein
MQKPITATPTEHDAAMIVQAVLHESVQTITRFTTGLCHYVYDVVTESNRAVVVRIASDNAKGLAGAVYWSQQLRPLGIPLPRILHADLQARLAPFPFLLLERLPGTDLGHVYPHLSLLEKRAIVAQLARIQDHVHRLPRGAGYGYVAGYDAPFPHHTWSEVIDASLARSRSRLAQAGIFPTAYIDQVSSKLVHFERILTRIEPVAFLDDTTTKNVIVQDGRLSGIVDVDVVCFGDPLWTVALTRMALLSSGYDLTYFAYWCELLEITAEQRRLLDFYTAVFCVDFMSELGQVFNQNPAVRVENERTQQLTRIFDELIQAL